MWLYISHDQREWPTHNIFANLKKIMIEKFLRIVGL